MHACMHVASTHRGPRPEARLTCICAAEGYNVIMLGGGGLNPAYNIRIKNDTCATVN